MNTAFEGLKLYRGIGIGYTVDLATYGRRQQQEKLMQIGFPRTLRSELPGSRLKIPLCFIGVLLSHATAAQQSPTIKLFPTEVVQNVRETGRVAGDIEKNLQKSMGELDQQWQLYRASQCDSAEDDPGCDQLAKQLGDTYLEMLLRMDANLPRMQALVQATVDSLEKGLREEYGLRMSASDLQKMLADQSPGSRRANSSRTGQPVGRLSERFRQYYQVVAQSQATTPGSMAAVAAEIYLDGKEMLQLITLTQAEIARSQLMLEMQSELGTLTPELLDVLNGVKNILFGGERLSSPGALEKRQYTSPEEYRSPLELGD